MKKTKIMRDHWYDGITDAFKMYVPGNDIYHSMRARSARIGTLFILPFILGFLIFMVKPLFTSFYMSLCNVTVVPGQGYETTFWGFRQYSNALGVDPEFNQLLTEEIGRMLINTIATLVVSFLVAVILNQNFKGRVLCRAIFFLPVILSSGVLPGIESQNEFYNMMNSLSAEMQDSAGVNLS